MAAHVHERAAAAGGRVLPPGAGQGRIPAGKLGAGENGLAEFAGADESERGLVLGEKAHHERGAQAHLGLGAGGDERLRVVAVGLELEIPFAKIREGLGRFEGVSRRFEVKGEARGVTVSSLGAIVWEPGMSLSGGLEESRAYLKLPLEHLRFDEHGEPLDYEAGIFQIQNGRHVLLYPRDRATGTVRISKRGPT